MTFRCRIHRGAQQIGGSCIELEAAGARILLDLGLPLDAAEASDDLLPQISGLQSADSTLRALVVSHGHGDHWGLIPRIMPGLPLAMGAATARILHAAAPFVPAPFRPEVTHELFDRRALEIGPFKIIPYLVDHSAYDAYALLIEARGRRLFYSGDIRGHGRKGGLFDKLIASPPESVDAFLMEGSSLGRLGPEDQFPSEPQIEERLVERFNHPGFVAVSASAQNIDRMVTLYRACKRTGRTLLLDLYALEILKATGNANIPQAGWPNVKAYVPDYQRRQIKRNKRFDIIDQYKPHRIFAEALPEIGSKAVMLFRPAMMPDIDKADLWDGGRAIWSQWDGYLKDGVGAKLKADLAARAVPLEVIHTSGHASILDLKRLAAAINPLALIPIHTFAGDDFSLHFQNVTRRLDGEWWGV